MFKTCGKLMILVLFFAFWAEKPAQSQQKICNFSGYDVKKGISRGKKPQNVHAGDHYALVFSFSPSFCNKIFRKNGQFSPRHAFQCQSDNQFRWILHGLWLQSEKGLSGGRRGGHPAYCQGDLPDLTPEQVKPFMCMTPSEWLISHEWEKHGACSFQRFEDYMGTAQSLYNAVKMPPRLLPMDAMGDWFFENNPDYPKVKPGWRPRSREFVLCYDLDLQPIDCR